MWTDVVGVWIGIASLAVGVLGLISGVVFFMYGRRELRRKMVQRADVARDLAEFNRRIYREGQNSKLLLMNAARYERGDYKKYQHDRQDRLTRRGELFVGGELGGLKHDGFEVLTGRSADGHPDALEMLFVPFDRVQWVNLDGDENFNCVIIYTTFKGRYPTPESVSYPVRRTPYKLRDDGPDHYMQIDGSPVTPSEGLRAWGRARKRWRAARKLDRADRRSEREFARQARR